jgi:GTP cyclohydrolase-4
MLSKLLVHLEDMPDGALVTVRSESEESIHKHNAFAERTASLGELRTGD